MTGVQTCALPIYQRGSPSGRPAPSLRVQSAGPSRSSVLWPLVVRMWLLRKDRLLIAGSVVADALSHRAGGRAVSGLVAPREGPVCKPCRALPAVSGRRPGGGLRRNKARGHGAGPRDAPAALCPGPASQERAGQAACCFGAGAPGLGDALDHGAGLQLVRQLPAAPEGPCAARGASPGLGGGPHREGGRPAPPAAHRPAPPWLWVRGPPSVEIGRASCRERVSSPV